jgi:GAF domain-containing protein
MLARGHKLQVGQTGMVGFVSAIGTPRIALDVGDDSVYFDNPDLPNTRSEMALPLRVANEIIGVLDVQSIVSNAFQEEDIEILSTLADQVAIAIQNARTYEKMQELVEEAQKESVTYLRDTWRILQSEETAIGYQVNNGKVNPLNRPLTSVHVKKAMKERQTVTENGRNAALVIPIRLRDEVIGVMDIHTPDEHEWDEDEVDIAEAVADRLSLALETSLLLKSTQRRAEIERITADISGKIGATTQFDSILRTAAEELSRVLGGSEVLVQIQSLETTNDTGN